MVEIIIVVLGIGLVSLCLMMYWSLRQKKCKLDNCHPTYITGFSTIPPLVGEVKKEFNFLASSISNDGENIITHPMLSAQVTIRCNNNDRKYELIGISTEYLNGCGCPAGIILEIIEEDNHDTN